MRSVIRVFVVDNQDLVRVGMCSALEKLPNIEMVGQAGSIEQAMQLCQQARPDVILWDLKPTELVMASALLNQLESTKILVTTSSLDCSLIPQFFNYGISSFFNKMDSLEELVRAIQLTHADRMYICPAIAEKIHFKPADLLANPFDLLSERELQVVLLLAYAVAQEYICKKLGINISTLKTHRTRFYEKLQVKNDVELTLLASRHGLISELDLV